METDGFDAQSFQSVRLSIQSSELGSPLITRKRVLSPFGSKGEDTLACGGGGWGTQFRRRDRQSGTLQYMYTIIPLRLDGIVFGIFQFLRLPEASCDAVMASMMIAPSENWKTWTN
jgi:hypothetical protein